jgi:ring-1,2-phenylacetyl-CoA epoxidase subunit PaaC
MTTGTEQPELDAGALEAVRDLILVLADSKRLLGYRYAEWMLGAPELETGIACSSMAQDEWGHARLLYSLLKGFDDDVDALEHGREPGDYRNMAVLDRPVESWPEVVGLMTLADGALSVQFESLRDSSYEPLRQRVEKLLEEEKFHAAHGAAWLHRLAEGTAASAAALREAMAGQIPGVLEWFGPDSERGHGLVSAGVVDGAGLALRERFLARVRPLLEQADVEVPEISGRSAGSDEFGEFDEARRRAGGGGPDEDTVRRIRGDHNRAFLMES